MEDLDDSLLADQAKQGDWKAFEDLISRYSGKIFGFAYFYLRNREDARDISQEVFYRVYKSLAKFDSNKVFFNWLYTIFLNTVRDYKRKSTKVRFAGEDELEAFVWTGKEAITPEEKICLFQAMEKLPDDDRLILILRYFQGMELKEIAIQLGMTENNIGVRIYRAKENLKKELKAIAYEF